MGLSTITSKVKCALTNSEMVNVIYDKMVAGQDSLLKMINVLNATVFGVNREVSHLIEVGNQSFYPLTSEEREGLLSALSDLYPLNGVQVFTLGDGQAIQIFADSATQSLRAVDFAGQVVTIFDGVEGLVSCTIPNAFTDGLTTTQQVLSDLVSSYDINAVIMCVTEGIRNGFSSMNDLFTYTKSQLPNLSSAALQCLSDLTSIVSQSGVAGFLSYIKDLYHGLSTAHSSNGLILFDNTDYVAKTFTIGGLLSGAISTISTCVGAIISIATPIVGLVVAGLGYTVSRVASYVEQNLDLSSPKVSNDSDNLSYAVPIHQLTWVGRDESPLFSLLGSTSKILEFKTPGVIHNAWKNKTERFCRLESRLDLGWIKPAKEFFRLRLIGGKEYFEMEGPDIVNWEQIVQDKMSDPEYYSTERTLTNGSSFDTFRSRITAAQSWRCLDLMVRFIRGIILNESATHEIAWNETFSMMLLDTSADQDYVTGVTYWMRDMQLLEYHYSAWNNLLAMITTVTKPFESDTTDYLTSGNAFEFEWAIENAGGQVDDGTTTNEYIRNCVQASMAPFYMGYNYDSREFIDPSWYQIESGGNSYSFTLCGTSIISKSSSYVIPPAYTRESLVAAAILSGVIIAAAAAITITTVLKVKGAIRKGFASKYANVENKREDLKSAIKTGDKTAIAQAEKDYVKSVKRYNLAASIYGQSSLNFTDGWQSGESSESIVSRITTAASKLTSTQLATDDNDLQEITLIDIYKLIAPL